jgi:hypothetical protein
MSTLQRQIPKKFELPVRAALLFFAARNSHVKSSLLQLSWPRAFNTMAAVAKCLVVNMSILSESSTTFRIERSGSQGLTKSHMAFAGMFQRFTKNLKLSNYFSFANGRASDSCGA